MIERLSDILDPLPGNEAFVVLKVVDRAVSLIATDFDARRWTMSYSLTVRPTSTSFQ